MDGCAVAFVGLIILAIAWQALKHTLKSAGWQALLIVIVILVILAALGSDKSGNNGNSSPSESSQSECGGTVKTVSAQSGVRIRSGPGTEYSKLGGISYGSTVCVIDETNGWSQIDTDGTDAEGYAGYVSNEFLE